MATFDVPPGFRFLTRTWSDSDNGEDSAQDSSDGIRTYRDSLITLWPGVVRRLPARSTAWVYSTQNVKKGTPPESAEESVWYAGPGPPPNFHGEYKSDGLATMVHGAWWIRWEQPWAGAGTADFDDAYTVAWLMPVPDIEQEWCIGHVGVWPSSGGSST